MIVSIKKAAQFDQAASLFFQLICPFSKHL